jgi:3-hydroxyacyl-[acyl-carrier-protein] dehydratase
MVDAIDACEPGIFIRARKLTSPAERYWQPDEQGAVMPAPLILEALCQAGAWLVFISTEHRRRAALVSIGSVHFTGTVRPGETLELEGTVDSITEEAAVFSGRVLVDGRTVLGAQEIMCAMINAEELEDPEQTQVMLRTVYRAGGGA